MRGAIILWLLASLSACHRSSTPALAEASFDGVTATDPAALRAAGERITYVVGCKGCHGQNLTGEKFDDDPAGYGVVWAPNLTRAVPKLDDAQLEAVLRKGVHPSRTLWVMPSNMFAMLSVADMTALKAYLRSLAPVGDISPLPIFGPKAIAEQKAGSYLPSARVLASAAGKAPADMGPATALGRHIVAVSCVECHGQTLEGSPVGTPNLDIAGAYSDTELTTLLSTGQGKTARDLGLMHSVGSKRLNHLTPHERAAVVTYLKARANRS